MRDYHQGCAVPRCLETDSPRQTALLLLRLRAALLVRLHLRLFVAISLPASLDSLVGALTQVSEHPPRLGGNIGKRLRQALSRLLRDSVGQKQGPPYSRARNQEKQRTTHAPQSSFLLPVSNDANPSLTPAARPATFRAGFATALWTAVVVCS